jgi:surface protein
MKKIVLQIILLIFTAQAIQSQTVVLDANNITVKWTGTTVPSPYFVQANPRGTGMEWFAIVNNTTKSNITNYAKNIQSGITYFTPPSTTTPIPFDNIVTTLVTNMSDMFSNANGFNQPIGSWNVSNVTNMSSMFSNANAFNQNIGAWNVSNVTNMAGMFYQATAFNQNIGAWNVSNVTNMFLMFTDATAFNENISAWNVSNVTDMSSMFTNATAFNQNIGAWNVSNVTNMSTMFTNATAFNQNIGAWNVSNVTNMSSMFTSAGLSTANYDALLIGWATISPNEVPLKPNVVFSGGNSKYCNGASARNILDFTPNNWTITDGGLDCSSLDTEEFETNSFKLYPNPVVSILNVKTDNNLINQPYTIIDGLGRMVLNGKLNEVDATINVDQLSKGIYYLKVAGKSATKFIKE